MFSRITIYNSQQVPLPVHLCGLPCSVPCALYSPLLPPYAVAPLAAVKLLPALSCLQSRSSEQPICCWCRWSDHIACSSLLRWAFALRLISLMTSSRSEYHCSSRCLPDLHLLPHRLSSALTEGWPFRPTVHSCHCLTN